MSEAKFNVGDRVRRSDAGSHEVPIGTIGTVVAMQSDGINTIVDWDNGVSGFCAGWRYIQLHSPAPTASSPQPAIVQRAIEHEQRAQDRQQYGNFGQAAAATEGVAPPPNEARKQELESENRSLRMQLGDALGSRDMLRNRCHELETALAFAEREVARLSKKAGRK